MVRLLLSPWTASLLSCLVQTDGFALLPITSVSRRSHASPSGLFGVNSNVNFARRVVEKVHPSVALVTPMGVRNMTTQGTGFVVNPPFRTSEEEEEEMYLLTAAHVAAPGYGLTVKFPGNKESVRATVVARDVPTDLALIQLDANETNGEAFVDCQPLKFATEESEVATGSLVFANGYPGGITGGPAITMGVVCASAEGFPIGNGRVENSVLHANTTFVVTDAAMSGGMSGGPLVDIDGRVCGVNALVRPDMRALGNYAISAKTCQEFLDSIPSYKEEGSIDKKTKPAAFRVVLYNDPMNKRERVARILREVAQLNETTANDVMMKAHTTGEGVVKEFIAPQLRTDADVFCQNLREKDILVEVQEMVA